MGVVGSLCKGQPFCIVLMSAEGVSNNNKKCRVNHSVNSVVVVVLLAFVIRESRREPCQLELHVASND